MNAELHKKQRISEIICRLLDSITRLSNILLSSFIFKKTEAYLSSCLHVVILSYHYYHYLTVYKSFRLQDRVNGGENIRWCFKVIGNACALPSCLLHFLEKWLKYRYESHLNNITLQATSLLCSLISYHQLYQYGSRNNLRGGLDLSSWNFDL